MDRHRPHSGAAQPGLERALTELGDALLRDAPQVWLRDSVLQRLPDTAPAGHPWDDGPLLLAYREGALDPHAVDTLEARLEHEPHLCDMLRQLDAIEAALRATGGALDDAAAEVDLREGVLAAWRAGDLPEAPADFDEALAAYLAGAATPESARGLAAAAAQTPEHQATWQGLRRLEDELQELGNELAADAPAVDLRDAVWAQVGQSHSRMTPRIVQRRPAARPQRMVAGALLMAASVLAVAGLWLVVQGGADRGPEGGQVATTTDSPSATDGGERQAATSDAGSLPQRYERPPALRPPDRPEDAPGAPARPGEATRMASRVKDVAIEEALAARRSVAPWDDRGAAHLAAVAQLQALASLTPGQARTLIDEAPSPEALAGLLRFLPPAEAIPQLEALAAANPDNAYVQYALADMHGYSAAAAVHLDAWRALDPDNALPNYLHAAQQLDRGNLDSALALLDAAADQPTAYRFSVLDAQAHAAALEASGVSAPTADVLAASVAGTGEYAALSGLGQRLLEHGAQHEAMGNTATAEALYGAALELGEQVDAGAAFAHERLAGLETQQQALAALERVLAPENQALLSESYALLERGFNELTTLLNEMDNWFAQAPPEEAALVSSAIVEEGNLSFFDILGLIFTNTPATFDPYAGP